MKTILSVTVICALLFCLCACDALPQTSSTPAPEASIEMLPPETEPSTTPDATTQPSEDPTPSAGTEPTPTESDGVNGAYVDIFHGDDNAEKLISESYFLQELAPQDILDALTNIGVFSEVVTSNSFTIDNYNVIHLDLDEAFSRQISAMGTSGEFIMMGSLVNSFLNAFDADGLSLTVDGAVLETGHNVYDYTLEFFES